MKLTTNCAQVWRSRPCAKGMERAYRYFGMPEEFGPDTDVDLLRVLDSNDVPDFLWALRTANEPHNAYLAARRIGLRVADLVRPIFEADAAGNDSIACALQAANAHIEGYTVSTGKILRDLAESLTGARCPAATACGSNAANAAMLAVDACLCDGLARVTDLVRCATYNAVAALSRLARANGEDHQEAESLAWEQIATIVYEVVYNPADMLARGVK